MSEFNFDEFESEFSHLDDLVPASSAGAPAWRHVVLADTVKEHSEECDNPDCVGDEVFEEEIGKTLDREVRSQELGQLTIEAVGEVDPDRDGLGSDAQFTITMNGRMARALSFMIGMSAKPHRMAISMMGMMEGLTIEELQTAVEEADMAEDFASMLGHVGKKRVDKIDFEQEVS